MASPDSEVLAQLKDIHLPNPVSWWPLAFGWYILAGLVLLMFVGLAYHFWRWHTNRLSKVRALKLLDIYRQQDKKGQNSQITCARVSELLKRVALVYFPRLKVAGLTGKGWVAFLNETGKNTKFTEVQYEIAYYPYESQVHGATKNIQIDLLFETARRWIKQRSKPCLN